MPPRAVAAKANGSRPLAIAYQPLIVLEPYARNARRHSVTQIRKLKASLMEFGWANPMLVAERQMIAGHARLEAALELMAENAVIPHIADPTTGPTIDLSHLTPAQRRGYILTDNRLAEEAIWDLDLLRMEFADLAQGFDLSLTGFNLDEMDTIMRGWNPDFARQEAVDAHLDPLIGLLRVRYRRADQAEVIAAIAEALKPFADIEIKQY